MAKLTITIEVNEDLITTAFTMDGKTARSGMQKVGRGWQGTVKHDAVMAELAEVLPDFTEDDLDELHDDDRGRVGITRLGHVHCDVVRPEQLRETCTLVEAKR